MSPTNLRTSDTEFVKCLAGCGAFGLERVRYFSRQLITPDDMTQEQEYFREKLTRHNRLLHGWGVVCGAWVVPGQGRCEVVVKPGYILGPYGDEILIDREVTVDLCREGQDSGDSPCGDVPDLWCSDVRVDRPPSRPLYLAVRYAECRTRPVHVQPALCGCDETACEYSRIRDSYAIKVLTDLPRAYQKMGQPDFDMVIRCAGHQDPNQGDPHPCPPCPATGGSSWPT